MMLQITDWQAYYLTQHAHDCMQHFANSALQFRMHPFAISTRTKTWLVVQAGNLASTVLVDNTFLLGNCHVLPDRPSAQTRQTELSPS
jgi:hypothetical protein